MVESLNKLVHPGNAVEGDFAFAISLMEYLVVPTFVLNADGRVIIWNKACERLTGVQAPDMMGTSDHWRAFYSEQRPCLADLVVSRNYAQIKTLYADGGNAGFSDFGVSAENWCVMPKLGHRLYLAIDAGPIYNEAGFLIAAVETLRDITAQKQAQSLLESLASSDGLTGLANRRSFDDRLAMEVRRATRDRLPLALLMIDIDFFKAYNDRYGHQKGDECLKMVANAIAGTVGRAADFAARYGGEEFAVIMPNTPLGGAMLMAERLECAIAELGVAHEASGIAKHVTLSIGGVVGAGADVCVEKIIGSADAALYSAKHQGRNRTIVVPLENDPARRVAV
jgi:diguanylate cyclase (GGDEF)-like protein